MAIPVEAATFNDLIARATKAAGNVFPEDIMLSILTLLPGKSIHRLKAVCQPWCQLFSNPEFMKKHKGMFSIDPNNESVVLVRPTAIESTKPSVYLINSNETKLEPSIVPLPLSKTETYTGCLTFFMCCNGLICMKYQDLGSTIVLWNPAMECFKKVNRIEEYEDTYAENIVSIGFGYDANENDFKVVRIISMFDEDDDGGAIWEKTDVYSVNSDAWTIIYEVDYKFAVEGNSLGTVNGNPYWYATLDEDGGDEEELVYFDVTSLAFRYTPLPPNYNGGLRLVDWKGYLGSIQYACNKEKTFSYAEVWVFGCSWRHTQTVGPIEGYIFMQQPLINGYVVWYKDGKYFLSDPMGGCVREIMIPRDRPDYFGIYGWTANFACALVEETDAEEGVTI